MERFRDRAHAGTELARGLKQYATEDDVLVLGLARGGIPVAFPVAEALDVPMDVFIVRKLGVPGHEELAMGAIASGGIRVINEDVVKHLSITEEDIARVAVPVGAPSTCQDLEALADDVVCLRTPRGMQAIGAWYQDFSQTSDEEVKECLSRAKQLMER
jgi:putative phosphoribosyl transferase